MPTVPAVDAWLASLDHPQADVIAAVRELVLAADPAIGEGIKWNAGSFRTTDWFGTFLVRGPKGPRPVTLVLHLGARAKGRSAAVADPAGILTWIGGDRATVTFADLSDVGAKAPALTAVVRAWVAGM